MDENVDHPDDSCYHDNNRKYTMIDDDADIDESEEPDAETSETVQRVSRTTEAHKITCSIHG